MSFEKIKYCGHDAFKFDLFDNNGTKYTVVCPGTDGVVLAGYALIVTYVDPPQERTPEIKLLVKEEE